MGLLILGHLLAAYFSFGFHHPDEHFQIWEWANYFVGLSPDQRHLPWEFAAQIRPWFQPFIHALGIEVLLKLQLFNPFTTAFIFRLLYAAANIWGLLTLWKVMKEKFSLSPLWLLYIGALWFFPYIHVRTSSENLAGIFLTFAFAYYLKHKRMFWTGILFGFAFVARPQIALGLVGFGLALLLQERKITRRQMNLLGAFLIPTVLGVVLDRIGYGNWVFTPYRYFTVNLVQGVAATFNPYPWYQYLIWIVQLNPLISLPLTAGVILYFRKQKFEELGAFVAFFLILHCFITNKEYRFIFPVLNLVPFMAAIGFQAWRNRKGEISENSSAIPLLASPFFLASYAVVSSLGFTVSSLRGAAVATLWPLHAVNHHLVPGETWISNRNYDDHGMVQYYSLPAHQLLIYHDGKEFLALLAAHPNAKALLDGSLNDAITLEMQTAVEEHCTLLQSAYPLWIYHLRTRFPGLRKIPYQAVYQCRSL